MNVTCAAVLLLPVNFSVLRVSWQTAQLHSVEEELALKEARWLQLEAGLQSTVTSLEHELELEREQHSKEVQSPLLCCHSGALRTTSVA